MGDRRACSARATVHPTLGDGVGGDDGAARLEARDAIGQVLRRLDRRQLEVLILSRVDRLTQAEIGDTLGIHERSVRRVMKGVDERLGRLRGGERGR
ncbi:MAG: hypothetical protein OEZ06_31975 [Myxococcales bacterium]|nr:hypothetical protein [Myxococcales bacterium]